MSKRKKKNKRQRPELGFIGFILAICGLGIVAYFLKDFQGVRYGSSLALIWVYVGVSTFVLGIIYFAQFVAPVRGDFGWVEGLRVILRSYMLTAQNFLDNPRGESNKKSAKKVDSGGIPASLNSLSAGYIQSYEALSITKGNSFVRAVGPRFVNLHKKEKIRQVVDLRTQLRTQPVTFNTRDGILIETNVTVIFRVKQNPEEHLDGTLYPFDKESIFKLSYLNTINEDGQPLGWPTQLTPRAAALVTQELTQYNLDGLINVPATAVSPIQEVSARIQSQLQKEFDRKGVQVIAFKVGGLTLPDDVKKQNIKTWQANWQGKIAVERASSEAEVIRRKKQARARAQVKIIETIIQNLESMRQERESDAYQVIILRMIDALEEAMSTESPGSLIPQQIMASLITDTSARVRSELKNQQALPGARVDDNDKNDKEEEKESA